MVKYYLFVLLLILSVSCTDDENENCYTTDVAYIIAADTPPEGKVNETINIPIDFAVYNGCGGFGKFIETKSGNTITIEVLAVYEGCICPMNVPVITKNYEFYSSVAGTYYLKFKSSPTEYIIDTLNIY